MNQQDLNQIAARGISEQQIEHQLEQIKNGFPFLKLEGAAAIGKGIMAPTAQEVEDYEKAWNDYKAEGHKIVKFVPASGAASRMFKNMFAFLDAPYDVPTTDFEKQFFENIKKFAFRKALCDKCHVNNEKGIMCLIKKGDYKAIVANLLKPEGLNYGQLPKGLLQFHEYEDEVRTPMEEHLVEAALYASSNGEANVHFTVSHDHLELFKQMVAEKVDSMHSATASSITSLSQSRNLAPIPSLPIQTILLSVTRMALCCSVRAVMVHSSRTSTRLMLMWYSSRILTMWFLIA